MPQETTHLSPLEESLFQKWLQNNKITDSDEPDTRYDYRGFFQQTHGLPHPPGKEIHFPDTYKQHGHPTFSAESKYSTGPNDGGRWAGETYLPQLATSRSPGMSPDQMGASVEELLRRLQEGK